MSEIASAESDDMPPDNDARRRLTVLLDESRSRLGENGCPAIILVGAAVFESSLPDVESEIARLFKKLLEKPSLEDSRSHKKFIKEGFHRANNDVETQVRFMEVLDESVGHKSYVFLDEAPPGAAQDTARYAELYWALAKTLFREFRHNAHLEFVFEENPSLSSATLERIVCAAQRSSSSSSTFSVALGKKREPHSLAIVDYTTAIFAAWWVKGSVPDPDVREYRDWKAIRGTVSVVWSAEHGALYRRGQPTAAREREAGCRSTKLSETIGSDSLPQDGQPLPPPRMVAGHGQRPHAPSETIGRSQLLVGANFSVSGWHSVIESVKSGSGYRMVTVRKRRHGSRRVAVPTVEVKSAQKRACAVLQGKLDYSTPACVHGYAPGKSALTNASMHPCGEPILSIDIENFFSSISQGLLIKALIRNGCAPDLAEDLAELGCIDGRLAPGFATSPYFSNLVFEKTDHVLERFAKDNGLRYSRYSDDISFSGDVDDSTLSAASEILEREGWRLNEGKTRFLRPGKAQYITGVYVGRPGELRAPRRVKRALRQAVHYVAKYGLDEKAASAHPRLATRARLVGALRYVGSFPDERGFVDRLWGELERSDSGIRRGRLERRFPRDASMREVLAILEGEDPNPPASAEVRHQRAGGGSAR